MRFERSRLEAVFYGACGCEESSLRSVRTDARRTVCLCRRRRCLPDGWDDLLFHAMSLPTARDAERRCQPIKVNALGSRLYIQNPHLITQRLPHAPSSTLSRYALPDVRLLAHVRHAGGDMTSVGREAPASGIDVACGGSSRHVRARDYGLVATS